jgi:VanZ family protein
MSDTQSSQPEPCMPRRRFQVYRWDLLLVLYWLAMFVGTHWPKLPLPQVDSPLRIDKILHFSGYLGLAVLLFGSIYLNRRPASLLRAAVVVALIIAGYGVLDELTQPYFGRFASWTDWFADLAGCAVGLACVVYWVRGTRTSAAVAP